MNKTIITSIIIVGVIAVIIIFFVALNTVKKSEPETISGQNEIQNQRTENVPSVITLQDGENIITDVTPDQIVDLSNSAEPIKEFKMTSFYEMVDGKPKPQYSLKEVIVKKGDTVKIEVTVTKGMHDFNIDEYSIHQETPLDQTVTIELKADKVGEFIYYCSKPGHRQNGHWGIFKVLDK